MGERVPVYLTIEDGKWGATLDPAKACDPQPIGSVAPIEMHPGHVGVCPVTGGKLRGPSFPPLPGVVVVGG